MYFYAYLIVRINWDNWDTNWDTGWDMEIGIWSNRNHCESASESSNQFGRRNLSAYDRSVLALKLKPIIAEKAKANQGTRTDISQKSVKSGNYSEDHWQEIMPMVRAGSYQTRSFRSRLYELKLSDNLMLRT